MEVKKSSWHYKLNRKLGYHEKRNETLCGYFWKTVGRVVWVGILTACVIGLGYTAIFEIPFYDKICLLIAFLSIGLAIAAPIEAIIKIRKIRNGEPLWAPGEQLTRSYIKAVKDKVCPIITFIN
ncbi:MAG: hypothetical protein KKD77_21005 [Gammaproteobacteria bacterium]|nr:hypothetical protein [Gammaproteobacteria bacterium]